MSHRARLLHILLSAPVTVLLTVGFAPSAHAQTSAAVRPTPYVVAIDAGHGGTPDNAHPDVPFDPGVIGPTGLLEKDVTLDVARKVQRLLEADRTTVVMTRSDDRFVDIGSRMQAAIDGSASLFVSIHMNSYEDPATGGTAVLYPGDLSLPFAQRMSDTLGSELAPLHLAQRGVQIKDDLWVHASMPAITVEGAYISNRTEEALMKEQLARDVMAHGIVVGIERQSPQILALKSSIAGWEAAHKPPTSASVASSSVALQQSGGHGVRNLAFFVIAMAAWWQRRIVLPLSWRILRMLFRLAVLGVGRLLADTDNINSRRSARERRRQRLQRGRRQTLLERSERLAPRRQLAGSRTSYHSVYDELRF